MKRLCVKDSGHPGRTTSGLPLLAGWFANGLCRRDGTLAVGLSVPSPFPWLPKGCSRCSIPLAHFRVPRFGSKARDEEGIEIRLPAATSPAWLLPGMVAIIPLTLPLGRFAVCVNSRGE
jgi:hypothetical protein